MAEFLDGVREPTQTAPRGFDAALSQIASGDGRFRQRTLADYVASNLHSAILRGEYPGGSALRIQELADRFETSAMPIREALRRLTALGLVEIVPHKGARVLDLSNDDLQDTFLVRLALEPLAAEQATQRMRQQEIDEATAALAALDEAIARDAADQIRVAHTEFHFAIYRAAGSPWLLRAIEPVWQNSERYRFANPIDREQFRLNHDEHAEILEACVSNQPQEARDAMTRHLEGAQKRMATSLPQAAEAE